VQANVDRLKEIFGEQMGCDVLARVPGAAGAPTMDELAIRLTEGLYPILHVVCHGRFNPADGETVLYLEQGAAEASRGLVLAQPITATQFIERLAPLKRLPYLVFLSICESSVPDRHSLRWGSTREHPLHDRTRSARSSLHDPAGAQRDRQRQD
jgi:hypothetical protein